MACWGGRLGAWRASDAGRVGSVRAYVEVQGRGQADLRGASRMEASGGRIWWSTMICEELN